MIVVRRKKMAIHKIVLTGGPCGGKSTCLCRVDEALTSRGYKVFVVPETATEIKKGGIKPTEFGVMTFQNVLMNMQLQKEKMYLEVAKKVKGKDVVILYDRGLLDSKAFMSKEEFESLLKKFKLSEIELRDTYDAVFHLKTTADGAEEFYTLGNNSARSETPEEAREVDKRIISAWTGHPHLRVIDNSEDFEGKISKLINEIFSFLGVPAPTEIERKYLIEMPNIKELCKLYSITKSNIIQTYLINTKDSERRIRQRGLNGSYSYFYTEKRKITELKRVETEKKISQSEYLDYMMEADTSLKQIRKDRYCFVYKDSYIEMDVYPFWKDNAIVEVELTNEGQKVELPPEIKVIREVTEDKRFKNNQLAKLSNAMDILTK